MSNGIISCRDPFSWILCSFVDNCKKFKHPRRSDKGEEKEGKPTYSRFLSLHIHQNMLFQQLLSRASAPFTSSLNTMAARPSMLGQSSILSAR